MGRLMVHITAGPEQPTRLALALLVARTALADGHDVDVFIAGDGVQVLRPETVDLVHGVGTGNVREHLDALVQGGARLFASGLSSRARGITGDAIPGMTVELVTPSRLVQLVFEAERIISY